MTTIREHIHRAMWEELDIDAPPADTDLITTGLLDSLAAVSLLVVLEERLGIKVPLAGLVLDDIRTVERLESTLANARAARPATRPPCGLD